MVKPILKSEIVKHSPLNITLNKEQASLLLKGLDKSEDKNSLIYKQLRRELETIIVIWDRRIKNDQIRVEAAKTKRPTATSPAPRPDQLTPKPQ